MEIIENGEKLIRDDEERIYVSVRMKPLNHNDVSDWECINDNTIVYNNVNLLNSESSMHPSAYTFDRVFSSDCSTREVYEHGAKDVAMSVVRGINSTVFTYGQTNSGKTYTMTGIVEYAIADIYEYIKKHSKRDYILKLSAMEIYNESILDLLTSDNTPLRLVDDPERGTIVEKLTEEILRDENHATELISICKVHRQIEEMSLNNMSSRSHLIIRLTIESSSREFLNRNNTSTLVATVNFVDLAGSEQASQSLNEGSQINHSLVVLETIIRKLSEDPNGHIPYKDSKLTRILQASLKGNSRTAIICTMSPAHSHVDQSRNTLLFAGRAKEVTTGARVNVVVSDKGLVEHLHKELTRLKSELNNSPTNYYSILREKDAQIEKLEKEIKDLILQRDIAQSQVQEFIRIFGDDASSITQVGSGHYPHLRVQSSPDSEFGKQESSPLADDATFFEDHVKVPFFEDNFEQGYTSPRILLSSSNSYVSDSDHAWDEVEKQSNPTSEDTCREVHCIETQKSNRQEIESTSSPPLVKDREFNRTVDNELKEAVSPIFKKDCEFSTIQYLDIAFLENSSSAYRLAKDSFGAKSLTLTRSSSCRASITSDSSSPWFKMLDNGDNTTDVASGKESEGCGGKMFTLKDCQNATGNSPCDKIDMSAAKFSTDEGGVNIIDEMSEKAELSTEQEITTTPVKEMAQEVNKSPKKNVKNIGLDPIQDECKGLTSWPVEFRRLRREIIELWHACNVSLVHRTYFFLLFQGDPTDAIYLEVELRRMKFLRDKFSRGDKTVVDGRTLTLSSSAKALRQERRMLSEQMSKKFSEQERENLFTEWGIGLNAKLRRLKLAHRLWSKTEDINHVTDSAFLVAKLVGLIEPGHAPNKEMFGLNFTPKCSTGICSFKRSLVSLL